MLEFDFRPIPYVEKGETKGYHMQPKVGPTLSGRAVFEEIARESGLHLPPSALESIFFTIIETAARLVEKDGRSRRLGNLKFMLAMRGLLESAYSEFDPKTCKALVIAALMKGWQWPLDPHKIDIGNTRIARRVKMAAGIGTFHPGDWERGHNLNITGDNVKLIEGDDVTVSWTEGTAAKSVAMEWETTSDWITILKWPSALDVLPVGTQLTLTWHSRGGVEDGILQTRERHLTLIEPISNKL